MLAIIKTSTNPRQFFYNNIFFALLSLCERFFMFFYSEMYTAKIFCLWNLLEKRHIFFMLNTMQHSIEDYLLYG